MAWWFLKKLNVKSPYDPALLLLTIYLKKFKAGTQQSCILIIKRKGSVLYQIPMCEVHEIAKSIEIGARMEATVGWWEGE